MADQKLMQLYQACQQGDLGACKLIGADPSQGQTLAFGNVVPSTPKAPFAQIAPKGMATGGKVMKRYADGGEVDSMIGDPAMLPMEEEMSLEEPSGVMIEDILPSLEEDETEILMGAIDMHPELLSVVEKIANTYAGEGMVEGPGTGTSDDVPARLSDGEFVFTAKAVQQIGVDKLRKMMEKAEAEADMQMAKQEESSAIQGFACGGLVKPR